MYYRKSLPCCAPFFHDNFQIPVYSYEYYRIKDGAPTIVILIESYQFLHGFRKKVFSGEVILYLQPDKNTFMEGS